MSAPFIRKFTLGEPGGERLPYVDANGAFLGKGAPLLEKDAYGCWRPRPQSVLETLFSLGYGEPIDLGWRMDRFAAVADALNRGDLCLAAIALVRAQLPELPDPDLADRMTEADGLCKAGFNVEEPRDRRGRWTTGDSAAAIVAEAKKRGGWLWPGDVHRGNEKECVSLVRAVIPGLPHSGAWKQGQQLTPALVQSGAIPPGTAIATFLNGRYNNTPQDHAAIYLGTAHQFGVDGISVLEQWHGRGGEGYTQRGFYSFIQIPQKHFTAGQFSTIAK